MKTYLPIAFTVGLFALTGAGFIHGHHGARNAALFFLWGCAIVPSLCLLMKSVQAELAAEKPAPAWAILLCASARFGCLVVLAWNGAFLTATGLLFAITARHIADEAIGKIRRQSSQATKPTEGATP